MLALRYDWGPRTLVVLHNLSSSAVVAAVDVRDASTARDLLTDGRVEVDGRLEIEIAAWGYHWLRVA